MDFQVLFSQMIQLFAMMVIGFVLFKVGILSRDFDTKLTRFIVDVTMPLLIISSVMEQTGDKDYKSVGIVFAVSAIWMIVMPAVGFVIVKLFRFPVKEQGLYMFMTTFSNIGFMGFPIISALYGEKAVLYTAVFNLVFTLAIYSIGILLLKYKNSDGAQVNLWKEMRSKLLSTGFLGALLAIILYFIPITYPAVLTGIVSKIGNLTSPLAMLLIGATLAGMPLAKIVKGFRPYLFALLKQIAIPLLAWPILTLVIKDSYMRGVLFVLILMPVANNSVLFSNRYGGDEELAAKNVFITTVLSMISIPLCAWIVGF